MCWATAVILDRPICALWCNAGGYSARLEFREEYMKVRKRRIASHLRLYDAYILAIFLIMVQPSLFTNTERNPEESSVEGKEACADLLGATEGATERGFHRKTT